MNRLHFPLNLIFRYRFTPWGMKAERNIVKIMSWFFFHGDEVTWESNRRYAYHKWMMGADIKKELDLPELVINNWITIWTAYNKAFGG